MFIVNFFRWLFGYAEFCLKSNFPERYLNIAFKNGLHLWKTKGEKESLKGCVKIKELNENTERGRKLLERMNNIRKKINDLNHDFIRRESGLKRINSIRKHINEVKNDYDFEFDLV